MRTIRERSAEEAGSGPAGEENGHSVPSGGTDPETWVDAYGDYLFRYAYLRLSDRQKAEDLVQETFLAALKGRARYSGAATERSWLTGILRNKIADHYRQASREHSFEDLEFCKDELSRHLHQSGLSRNCWIAERGPADWPSPDQSLHRQEFWDVFHQCSGKLSAKVAKVFLMREMEELEQGEICSILNITPENFWVMMHRARLALRRCLELHWFKKRST